MTKQELAVKLSEKVNLTKKEAETVINALIGIVEEALIAGEKVQLVGFGTFEVRERAERQGRNPQTGQQLLIPASKSPAFKPGKSLKEAVNQ